MSSGGESGQVTVMVALLTATLLACAGLVLDGGRILAARREAADVAAAAARAGAQAVSVDELRTTNRQVLDPERARAAATRFLTHTGHEGVVSVDGDAVTVSVRITVPMAILGIVGLRDRTVAGTETARTVRGVLGAET